jgi:hypothetical protein
LERCHTHIQIYNFLEPTLPSSVQQEKKEKEKEKENKLMRGTELLLAIYNILDYF